MKKRLCLFLSMLCIVSACSSCGCSPKNKDKPAQTDVKQEEQLSYPLEPTGTPLPNLVDDTSGADLGVYGSSAFGIVMHASDERIILQMQHKYFEFTLTEKARRHYIKLGVALGDEVAVPYSIADDGSYIADDVELIE